MIVTELTRVYTNKFGEKDKYRYSYVELMCLLVIASLMCQKLGLFSKSKLAPR